MHNIELPRASRRSFGIGLAATAATVGVVRSPAPAAQYNFKIADNTGVEHPRTVRINGMARAIEQESGGRIHMQVFPNNQLGGDAAMLSQLRLGALDFLAIDSALMAGVVPVAGITAMGFVFKDPTVAFRVMDGALGDYIRKDIVAKGLYPMHDVWDSGMRDITSGTHPIRTADDLQGFKIRTPAANIWVDLFKSLGANPSPIEGAELYAALQTKLVDGQDASLITDEVYRAYEVQKYLSLTNHMWGGCWIVANGTTWNGLPADLQQIISRNSDKYAKLERTDMQILAVSLADKLARRGMIVNSANTDSFRAKLTPYYQYWKGQFGPTAWGLLEAGVGRKLG